MTAHNQSRTNRPKHFLLISVSESDTERFITALLNHLPAGWSREKDNNARFSPGQRLVLRCTQDQSSLRGAASVLFHRCSKNHLAADSFTHLRRELSGIARGFILLDLQEALSKSGFLYATSYWDEMIDADVVKVFTNKCVHTEADPPPDIL